MGVNVMIIVRRAITESHVYWYCFYKW